MRKNMLQINGNCCNQAKLSVVELPPKDW